MDPETLRSAFLWREKRQVRKDATISLQGNRYQVPANLVGRTLELRFDPFDLSCMELYLDGKPLGHATVLLQGRSRHLATLLLVGHPDLRRTLLLAVHEALAQRITVRYHLGPMDLQETTGYVKHHVRVAGYTAGPLFTDDAVARIFDYTKGLPRRINNQVCTTALMAGLTEQKSIINDSTVRKAIANIDQD